MKTVIMNQDASDSINRVIRNAISSNINAKELLQDLEKVRRLIGDECADDLIVALDLCGKAQIYPSYLEPELI